MISKFVMAMLHYLRSSPNQDRTRNLSISLKIAFNRVLKSFVIPPEKRSSKSCRSRSLTQTFMTMSKLVMCNPRSLLTFSTSTEKSNMSLEKPMTPEAKEALLDEIKEDMRVLVDTLNNMSMSAGMEMAVLLGNKRLFPRRIERAA